MDLSQVLVPSWTLFQCDTGIPCLYQQGLTSSVNALLITLHAKLWNIEHDPIEEALISEQKGG